MEQKILIVEDERNLRQNLAEILSQFGYTTSVAANAAEALSLIKDEVPDLVLCDIIMPGQNGYDLLKELQQLEFCENVPFIFMSARAEVNDIRYGMNMGADDYIVKPFKANELITAIQIRLNKIAKRQINEHADAEPDDEQKKKLTLLLNRLSSSEMKVMCLLGENMTSIEISQKLFLSPKTIQNHRFNIVQKLGIKGQNRLLSMAVTCKALGIFK